MVDRCILSVQSLASRIDVHYYVHCDSMGYAGMTYILLEEKDSTQLIKKVNAMLVAGWYLQGGIAFNADKGTYLQAMVITE